MPDHAERTTVRRDHRAGCVRRHRTHSTTGPGWRINSALRRFESSRAARSEARRRGSRSRSRSARSTRTSSTARRARGRWRHGTPRLPRLRHPPDHRRPGPARARRSWPSGSSLGTLLGGGDHVVAASPSPARPPRPSTRRRRPRPGAVAAERRRPSRSLPADVGDPVDGRLRPEPGRPSSTAGSSADAASSNGRSLERARQGHRHRPDPAVARRRRGASGSTSRRPSRPGPRRPSCPADLELVLSRGPATAAQAEPASVASRTTAAYRAAGKRMVTRAGRARPTLDAAAADARRRPPGSPPLAPEPGRRRPRRSAARAVAGQLHVASPPSGAPAARRRDDLRALPVDDAGRRPRVELLGGDRRRERRSSGPRPGSRSSSRPGSRRRSPGSSSGR